MATAIASVAIPVPDLKIIEPEVVTEAGTDWSKTEMDWLEMANQYMAEWIQSGRYEEEMFGASPALSAIREKKIVQYEREEEIRKASYVWR